MATLRTLVERRIAAAARPDETGEIVVSARIAVQVAMAAVKLARTQGTLSATAGDHAECLDEGEGIG